jgi:hypothetical protein
MCDWGEVGRLQEVTPSLYGFTKEQNATNAKKVRWWVALKLFFVYSHFGAIVRHFNCHRVYDNQNKFSFSFP